MGWDIFEEAEKSINTELKYHNDIVCGRCKESFTEKDVEDENIETVVSNHTEFIDDNKQVLRDGSYITTIRLSSQHIDCPEEEDDE